MRSLQNYFLIFSLFFFTGKYLFKKYDEPSYTGYFQISNPFNHTVEVYSILCTQNLSACGVSNRFSLSSKSTRHFSTEVEGFQKVVVYARSDELNFLNAFSTNFYDTNKIEITESYDRSLHDSFIPIWRLSLFLRLLYWIYIGIVVLVLAFKIHWFSNWLISNRK